VWATGNETSTEHLTLGAQDATHAGSALCSRTSSPLAHLSPRPAQGRQHVPKQVRSLADARRLARRGPLSRCQTLTSGFPRSLQKPAANADTQRVEAGEG